MNQILLTNDQNIKKNGNNKYNRNNSGDMKKIIIFFAIAIFIFALLIIGIFSYKTIKKNNNDTTYKKPELSIEQTEKEIKIVAKAEAGISKIIYIWNNSEPIEIEMNGRTSHEEVIDIPLGQNTLKVKIIDGNNQEIETEGSFYLEEVNNNLQIKLDKEIGNGKLKIIATDDINKIEYITYKWNDEQETTVVADEENQTVLEEIIDVRRGTNKITVTAVNGNAKSETIEDSISGVYNPTIEVTRDNNILYMKISHDIGIKKIEFTVNGQQYTYDENYAGYDSELKEIELKFNMIEGENTVIIHAISMESKNSILEDDFTESTYMGKCYYIPE